MDASSDNKDNSTSEIISACESAFKLADINESGALAANEFESLLLSFGLCGHADAPLPASAQARLFHSLSDDDGGGAAAQRVVRLQDFRRRMLQLHNDQHGHLAKEDLSASVGGSASPSDGNEEEAANQRCAVVIQPDAWWFRMWKNAMILLALYYFATVPVNISFVCYEPCAPSTFLFSWALDITLWIDIVLNFHVAYVNKRHMPVVDPGKIRRHYLKTGFFYDALAAAPLDAAIYIVGANTALVAWFRLPRLLRLRDYSRHIARMRKDLKASQLRVELQWLFSVMFGIFHVAASVFWYFTQELSPRASIDHALWAGGDAAHYLMCAEPEECGPSRRYAFALWWVVGEILMTGHGGLFPSSERERLFSISLLVLNLSLFAYITSAMSNFILSADEQLVAMRAGMTAAEQYIKANGFSAEVEAEMRKNFDFLLSAKAGGLSGMEENKVYSMLSHALQVDVSQYTSRALLDSVRAFHGCSHNFLDDLAVAIRERTLPPCSFLFHVNDVAKALYFVASGVVEVLAADADAMATDPKVDKVHDEGSVVGEVPFFFRIRQLSSTRTRANEFVRIYELGVSDYHQLLQHYPEEERIISKNVTTTDVLKADLLVQQRKEEGSAELEFERDTSSTAGGEDLDGGDAPGGGGGGGGKRHSKQSTMEDKVMAAIELGRKKKEEEEVRAMISAAAAGSLAELKARLRQGDASAVNCADVNGRTPLHLAASNGHLEVVEWLAQQDADLHATDFAGRTAMADAIVEKHDAVSAFLRSKGCRIGYGDASGWMCRAAAHGDLDQLKRLMKNLVAPDLADYESRTALHLAASEGQLECCAYLLSQWADPNPVDRWGGTPLSDAVRHGHAEIQRLLVSKKGALPSDELAGRLCQHAADGDVVNMEVLVNNGADINLGDYDDRTALHLAASTNNLGVVEWLVKLPNIDINPVDRYGGTPTEDAVREGHSAIEMVLRSCGGLRKGSPELAQKLVERDARLARRFEDAQEKRTLNVAKDQGRDELFSSVEAQARCLDGPCGDLQVLVELLCMTLHPAGAATEKAVARAPQPDLNEILSIDTFCAAFREFTVSVHSNSLLDFVIAARKLEAIVASAKRLEKKAKASAQAAAAAYAEVSSDEEEPTPREIKRSFKKSSEKKSGKADTGKGKAAKRGEMGRAAWGESTSSKYSSPRDGGVVAKRKPRSRFHSVMVQARVAADAAQVTADEEMAKADAETLRAAARLSELYTLYLVPGSLSSINPNPAEVKRVRRWLSHHNPDKPRRRDTITGDEVDAEAEADVDVEENAGSAGPTGPPPPIVGTTPPNADPTARPSAENGEPSEQSPQVTLDSTGDPSPASPTMSVFNSLSSKESMNEGGDVVAMAMGSDGNPTVIRSGSNLTGSSMTGGGESFSLLSALGIGGSLKGKAKASKSSVKERSLSAHEILRPLREWAEQRLAGVLPNFYAAPSYKLMLTDRTGRFWRVVTICGRIHTMIAKIEKELVVPLEATAVREKITLVYDQPGRSAEVSAKIRGVATDLRTHCGGLKLRVAATARSARRLFKKLELRDAMRNLAEGAAGSDIADGSEEEDPRL